MTRTSKVVGIAVTKQDKCFSEVFWSLLIYDFMYQDCSIMLTSNSKGVSPQYF